MLKREVLPARPSPEEDRLLERDLRERRLERAKLVWMLCGAAYAAVYVYCAMAGLL